MSSRELMVLAVAGLAANACSFDLHEVIPAGSGGGSSVASSSASAGGSSSGAGGHGLVCDGVACATLETCCGKNSKWKCNSSCGSNMSSYACAADDDCDDLQVCCGTPSKTSPGSTVCAASCSGEHPEPACSPGTGCAGAKSCTAFASAPPGGGFGVCE